MNAIARRADLVLVEPLSEEAQDFGRASLSANTIRAYRADWSGFQDWCAGRGLRSLPATPGTVANYASSLAGAGRKVPTIARKMAAIRYYHRAAGQDNPVDHGGVAAILKGIRRRVGTAPKQKAAATVDIIHRLLAHIPADTLQGVRDRAIILLGFAGAFRRSELVGIGLEDLTFTEQGLDVFLPRSKTDQEGNGATVAILNGKALRPADAVREWIEAAGITSGKLFRQVGRAGIVQEEELSAQSVGLVIKRLAAAAKLDVASLSAHSLRAGFITSAAEHRASISRIMEVSRHRDPRTVETYVRRADRYRDHAGEGFL